jgi:hypothetical protein
MDILKRESAFKSYLEKESSYLKNYSPDIGEGAYKGNEWKL